MDYRQSVAMGQVAGAVPMIITGSAFSIDMKRTPFMLSEAQLPPKWMVGPTPMEIVSTSANDAPNAPGARIVEVRVLDGSYVESVIEVPLNGTTPVRLPVSPMFINGAQVISAGSDDTNAGNITIRTSSTNYVQAYIPAGRNSDRTFRYTVPAGKTFLIDNFYNTSAKSSSGDITLETVLNVRQPTGRLSRVVDSFTQTTDTPFNIILPVPYAVKEKTTIFSTILSASNTGANYSLTAFGILMDN